MELPSFIFGGNTGIDSPGELSRTRKLVEAMQQRATSRVPQNPWEGINSLTGALVSRQLGERADQYETEQRTAANDSFNSLFGEGSDPSLQDMAGLAGNEFATPGQQGLINALLAQKMRESDPLYQQNLTKGGLEIESMQNPAPPSPLNINDQLIDPNTYDVLGDYRDVPEPKAPTLTSIFDPETGRSQKGYMGPDGNFIPVGGTEAPSDPLVTVNTGDVGGEGKAFYEALDKDNATMFSTLQQDGINAGSSLIKIQRMGELLGNIDTGAGAAWKQAAANFGLPVDGASEIQAAQAIINQLVPAQRPAGSGPMSDADLELFKQSMPRIINQPGGNEIILQTMQGIAEYTQAQGAIADQVANREITPAEGRKMLRDLPNPLEKLAEATKGFKEQTSDLPEGVREEDIEHTMKIHGLTREQVLEKLNAR